MLTSLIIEFYLTLINFLHYWVSKGGLEIGEANSDDISIWCHLCRCPWPDQEDIKGTLCHCGWFTAVWCCLLCREGVRIILNSVSLCVCAWCLWVCIYNFVRIISLHEQTTLTALGEMFEAARSIMSWLGDCAKVCLIYLVIYLLIMQGLFFWETDYVPCYQMLGS